VEKHKPEPEGLLRIGEMAPGKRLCYIGDTVDDALCARWAGVPFVGVAAPANPRHAELKQLLLREGADAVLEDVNQLEDVLAP
jgi:HAD superfamily phosphatase